ncbi:unnamed protein product [Paramecium sonneborni]|uniref:Uncharacterized protein n=1 Tax=Paramecium sonneborni TaxID=65129 RepID=A0A8S1RAZ7_9CILI|nr:unnamed protein product [Paramecium sonneborni]
MIQTINQFKRNQLVTQDKIINIKKRNSQSQYSADYDYRLGEFIGCTYTEPVEQINIKFKPEVILQIPRNQDKPLLEKKASNNNSISFFANQKNLLKLERRDQRIQKMKFQLRSNSCVKLAKNREYEKNKVSKFLQQKFEKF